MPAADLAGDAEDDDADPFAVMRGELGSLGGGLTVAPTHKDALGRGKDAAPASDYDSRRFGFDQPENLIPLRRQALVDALAAYGIPGPLLDERAAAAAYREAVWTFRESTLPALGAIIAEQVGEQIGQLDLRFVFPHADISLKARAVNSLTQAGITVEDARELVGL